MHWTKGVTPMWCPVSSQAREQQWTPLWPGLACESSQCLRKMCLERELERRSRTQQRTCMLLAATEHSSSSLLDTGWLDSLRKFLVFRSIFILCVYCLHICVWCVQCPWRPEEGARSSGTRVADGCAASLNTGV